MYDISKFWLQKFAIEIKDVFTHLHVRRSTEYCIEFSGGGGGGDEVCGFCGLNPV